ncbi:hypothetical protein E0Z10_g1546 [Xylaria hypoxylon]|uniref:BTB domain-containing protein n=1 Tax=Xylaria hypoxylon TaxID=37992 RepID=A0A4Z0Z8J1_9PEZI|nr:hypothetical protein E0Z10_g1546 [Xylaria hypoxylon]
MEDSATGAPDGGDSSSEHPEVIVVSEHGDVVLDATFQNSKDTIRSARKASVQPRHATGRWEPQPPQPLPKARVRLAFRVDLAVLKGQSKYFDKLLGDSHFKEANDVADAFAALSLKNVKPGDAHVKDLPWVEIHDDDVATSYAYREMAFADLLRILHGQDAKTGQAQITMSFVTTLAVLADRFDCAVAVSKYVATGLKFKWPVTSRGKPVRDDGAGFSGMSRANENVLRQKILVSWLLNQPAKFQAATRELIMNGSCQWSSFGEEEDETASATWWYLQDGLEQELQYRRNSVLNTLASVPRHFLMLYTASRSARQCKLGYDSSVACDSYQLGEMFKFLTNKGLLFLVDFSPASLDAIADTALLPVDHVLATLRQCPAYQIDKNHTNCGLRTRLLPILDFIQALLSANSIPVSRTAWKSGRAAHAWMPGEPDAKVDARGDGGVKPFRFTRALAGDQRLRFENAMGADKFARDVFTATSWDWTAEDQGSDHVSTTPRWAFRLSS